MSHLLITKFRRSFLIILLIGYSSPAFSQISTAENDFFDRVRFGGSAGLSFNNGFFSASLSPKAVYDFGTHFSGGLGVLGSYSNASNYTSFNVGGSVFGLFRPLPALQLSAEFEELHVSRNWEYDGANRKDSYWYPALFLGIGYNTGPVTVGIRYDVLYDDRSIYGNALMPFVSVYF